VNGQVRDTSGAAIPHASVEVINDATNIRYATETDDEGIYSVPNLPPGTFHIRVSKQGFKTIVHPDITLNVQDAQAIGFTLPIGPVSDTVTVEGGAPLINTESAAVSTVVDRQFAENLPMNGRSFQTLIQLTPGVVLTVNNNEDSGQFSVNGQRATSNYWMVDGVSANIGVSSLGNPGNGFGGTLGSFSVLGGTNSLVSVDALQEFRIQTSTYAPEFGRTPGAQISIVTRSGANQFHGTAFDYFRNDILDANNWFADSAGLAKPQERQNDFGGTFSGPIVRDRTFFFFSYEGLRLRLPKTELTTVPCDTTCAGAGNVRAAAVSAMQPYLNAYPLPNGPEVLNSSGNPTGTAEFNSSFSNPATLDAYSLRVDHRLNDKLSLFGRYNYSPSKIGNRGGSGGLGALSVLEEDRITTQTATVGTTWIISPAVTNDLRFNYSRVSASSHLDLTTFGGAVPLPSLGFPSSFTNQNADLLFEDFALKSPGLQLLVGRGAQNLQRQINVADSLSVQHGSHNLKLGVDFRRLSPMISPPLYGQFALFFSLTPSGFASAETGNSFFVQTFSQTPATLLFRNLGLFAQDTWRIAPRLTLTYGLRWDVDIAPSSLTGPSIPAVTGYNLADFSKLAIAPAGTAPFETTYGNVAPRLGVAYQVSQSQDWQTVLRGGFGVFYDLVSSETGTGVGFGASGYPPFGASNFFLFSTFPLDSTKSALPPIPSTGSLSQLFAFNPNLKLPYTLEWNIALEQALGRLQTLSATYIGASGRRLLQTSNVSAPATNPNVGTVGSGALFVDNTASSNYNALEIEFQRRLSRGIQALASYTWSHSIDTASASSTFLNSNNGLPGSSSNANRGSSDFDIRNAFSAGLTYDIPAPKLNAFTNAILRGWSAQNIIQVRSAPPVNISDENFSLGLSGGIDANVRPDLVAGQPLYLFGPQFPGGKAFNPAAFTDPPTDPNNPGHPARQGTTPRNFLRGFGATQWDFAVHRDFPIRESLKLQFRAEMFNVLNHPNFGQPDAQFGTGGFGLSTQTLGQSFAGGNVSGGAFSPLYQFGGPRSIQFALKFLF